MRTVRNLRLRAADNALARRGVILLEDALRTATLPGADSGRLLVVRSLNAGIIHAHGSAASVALNVERRFRELSAAAVSVEDPSAGRAPAVWFEDEIHPYVLAASRWAQHLNLREWFWPRAIAGWRALLSESAPGLAPMIAALVQEFAAKADAVSRSRAMGARSVSQAQVMAAQFVRELAERRVLDPYLARLTPEDGEALFTALGWPRVRVLTIQPNRSQRPETLVTAAVRQSLSWIPRWGADDPRSVWLARVAVACGSSGVPLSENVVAERAASVLRSYAVPVSLSSPARDDDPRETPATPAQTTHSSVSAGTRPVEAAGAIADAAQLHSSEPRVNWPALPFGEAVPTEAAGLLFVMPALLRMGAEPYLPLAGVPLLKVLCAVSRTPASDPIRLYLDSFEMAPACELAVTYLAFALRRWLRRYAKMGARELTRRPGRVSITRTHIDVIFDHKQADMRIRKAGLDLNPGWTPFLGKIVQFQYFYGEQ